MSASLVPYAFAREFGMFDAGQVDGALTVFFRQDGDLGALSELQRNTPLPVNLNVLSADEFQQRLALAFNDGGGRAVVVHGALTPPTVFVVGHGSMSEADFVAVAAGLQAWVDGGCAVD